MNNSTLNIIKLTQEEHNSLHREVLNRHRRASVWNGKKIVK